MNIFIIFTFYCLTLLFIPSVDAQQQNTGTIKGVVIDDSTEAPVQFVNVVVKKESDTTIVTGNTSDKTGSFIFKGIPDGEYFVTFSLVGYRTKKTPAFLIDEQHKHLNLGEINLSPTEVSLDEVLITAEKSLMNVSIDRKVYNVDQDLMGKTGSASELLQNVPSVQVDLDGNVSLRGSSNALIMLNGRASPMMKKNSATVLQQMPASAIERIEVITNPSAKYKPDGTAGIINIVLKKNSTIGINGTLSGNAGNQDRYNGNLRLNYSPGVFNLYASYGIRRDSRNRINEDNRLLTDSVSTVTRYNEMTKADARPLSHSISTGLEYTFDEQNQFGISGEYFYNSFIRTEQSDKRLSNINNTLLNYYIRSRYDEEFDKEYSFTTFFEHNFPGEDHTLRFEFNNSTSPEVEDNRYTNRYLLPTNQNEYDNTMIKNSGYENQISLEYSNPLTEESSLEAGYSGEFTSNDLDFYGEYLDSTQQTFVKDAAKTNRFLYNDWVHALYGTYKQSIGEFGFMAGLRAEHASVKSNLITLNSIITNAYVSLYPTVHFSYKLNKLSEFQLSYSKRTNRPESDDLNPFPEYRDPRNVSAGNPKLHPEYVHSFELGYQFQNDEVTILPALFYRLTYNKFAPVLQLINDSILFTTRQNLANDQAGGVELIVSADLTNLFTLHGNVYAFMNRIDASNLGYSNTKTVTTWSSALTVDIHLGETSRMQINSNYNSSRLTPQGEYSPSYSFNTGFRQELFDNQLSLVLTIADVFKTLKREYILDTPTFKQTTLNTRDSRIVYLGFTYNFGIQSKKAKEEQMRYDEGL